MFSPLKKINIVGNKIKHSKGTLFIIERKDDDQDCFDWIFLCEGQDDIETDLEDEEGPNTIQEAIKQEAKKLGPGSANQDQLYRFSDKDFMLPGKVYGCTFNKHNQDCYQIPDGFVTPLRATPHR